MVRSMDRRISRGRPCAVGSPPEALRRSAPRRSFASPSRQACRRHEEPVLKGADACCTAASIAAGAVRMGHDAEPAARRLLHDEDQLVPAEAPGVTASGCTRLTSPDATAFIIPAPASARLTISVRPPRSSPTACREAVHIARFHQGSAGRTDAHGAMRLLQGKTIARPGACVARNSIPAFTSH